MGLARRILISHYKVKYVTILEMTAKENFGSDQIAAKARVGSHQNLSF